MIFNKTTLLLQGLTLGLALGAASSAWAMPEMEWNDDNKPTRMGTNYYPYFDETGTKVPMSSVVPLSMMPYADTYWPGNRGGIAYRWNAGPWINPYLIDIATRFRFAMPNDSQVAGMDKTAKIVLGDFIAMSPEQKAWAIQTGPWNVRNGSTTLQYQSPNREQAMKMSREQLMTLSPTEKYDLVRSLYKYPMTHEVLSTKGVGPFRAYWEGICHGWAPASVNHAEPLPVDVLSSDQSVTVPFASADVKAILDYMYTNPDHHLWDRSGSAVNQIGLNCKTDLTLNPNAGGVACQGVNAGSFHIWMTNYIALRHQPFVADVSHGKEIWNNPIYSYDFEIVPSAPDQSGPVTGSAPGTVRRVHIKTTVRFPSDDERFAPQRDATVGREEVRVPEYGLPISAELAAKLATGYRYDVGNYDYWLELGKNDQILGGAWVSFERPDYVWMMPPHKFEGDFEALGRIYKPAFNR